MNHRIRDKNPSGPVILAHQNGKTIETDTLTLEHQGQVIGKVKFRKSGLKSVKTHHVRAWVELYNVNVKGE